MRTNGPLLTIGLVLTAMTAATAATAAPAERVPTRPEMRHELQQQYILSALWEGRMAWVDAKGLLAEQDAVRVRLERFRSDGGLTAREVAVLDYMLDISSANIDRFLREPTIRPRTPPAGERVAELLASL